MFSFFNHFITPYNLILYIMTQEEYTKMEAEFYQELSDFIFEEQEAFALWMLNNADMTYPCDDDLPF
jgi:hypothetical protein